MKIKYVRLFPRQQKQAEASHLRSVQSQDADPETPPPRFYFNSARFGFGSQWETNQGPRGAGRNVRRRSFGSTGCVWKLNSGVSRLTADVWLPLALVQQKAQTEKSKDSSDSENVCALHHHGNCQQ